VPAGAGKTVVPRRFLRAKPLSKYPGRIKTIGDITTQSKWSRLICFTYYRNNLNRRLFLLRVLLLVGNLYSKEVLTSPMGQMGWHENDQNALAKQIEGFIGKATSNPSDDIIALISPHAGYAYSGQTAASALRPRKQKYRRIIVIGHRTRSLCWMSFSVPGAANSLPDRLSVKYRLIPSL